MQVRFLSFLVGSGQARKIVLIGSGLQLETLTRFVETILC